jgi:RNA polymerase sigma-70 factor (ECF subfamily)
VTDDEPGRAFTVTDRTDTELMMAVRDGDLSSLADLFDRHHARFFNFFLRLTARADVSEDLVQEAFMRALKYRESYRGDADFVAWMYRVARNVFADHFRATGSRESLEEAEALEDAGPSPFERARLGEEVARLRAALLHLSVEDREVLVMTRFEGLSHGEIAEALGCSVGAVKVRAHRALARLRYAYFGSEGERPCGANSSAS